MRSTRTVSSLASTVLAAAGLVVLVPTAAHAEVACNENALVAAINEANAGGGATINLAAGCTYTLTSSHGSAGNGPDGLPVITTVIALVGTASIITRSRLAPAFRIAEVSASGNFTLTGVTLSNGRAANHGGGGIRNAGAVTLTGSAITGSTAAGGGGGGIRNLGALTLTSSAITGNRALLGNGGGISTGPSAAAAATFTSSTLTGNTAVLGNGGGIHSEGGTVTFTSTAIKNNQAKIGGGVASINAIFTTTSTPVTVNTATITAGGVYRLNGTMTSTTSPVTANITNNCVSSSPVVPGCID
jgi:hypothetical protein